MFNINLKLQDDSGAEGKGVGEATISGIHGYQQKITKITDEKLHTLMIEAYQNIMSQFPKKTGKTSDAITLNILGDMKYEIVVNGEKNVFVFECIEYGTKDHGPVSAKALRFKGANGKWVYTKWVRGINGRFTVRFAMEALMAEIESMKVE